MRALRSGNARELMQVARVLWGDIVLPPRDGEPGRDRNDYTEWVRRYDTLCPEDIAIMRGDLARWEAAPVISVVMPTYNTRREWLIQAVESVRAQVYPHWELCIADDASTEPHIREVLDGFAADDTRIRVVYRDRNGHISAASNSALELATGDWIALLDHDDVLRPHALYWVAKTAVTFPIARMIYSDEDKIDEQGNRFGAYFKPDWNPDLFRSQNMFSHLGAFRTSLVRAAGGFRVGMEGSQDHDLALRCMELVQRDEIVHVPRVLYHWRVHEASTALTANAKPYALSAGERALNDHFGRTGVKARVQRTDFGYRTEYELRNPVPRVGVIIIGAAPSGRWKDSVEALLASEYPEFRIYVPASRAQHRHVQRMDKRVQVVPAGGRVDEFSAAMTALRADECTVLCIVQAGALPCSPGWLTEMASQCMRPDVGIVGAKLVDNKNRVLSAGVMVGAQRRLLDLHAGYARNAAGYAGRCQLLQQCTMVRTTCAAIRVRVYDAVMGPDELPHVDGGFELCRRVKARQLDIVWTPYAEFRVPAIQELQVSLEHPREFSMSDPAYNPNLHPLEADFSLAWPPLVTSLDCRSTDPQVGRKQPRPL